MFCLALSIEEIRLIRSAPGVQYQAARWIANFHRSPYSHIGALDDKIALDRYGFIRVPRFELNAVQTLLKTHGPVLVMGAFSHLAQHESRMPIPEMNLLRADSYEDGDHAVVLTGFRNGLEPQLLYRDPAHTDRQFVDSAVRLMARRNAAAGLFYFNCSAFPKPCAHVKKAAGEAR